MSECAPESPCVQPLSNGVGGNSGALLEVDEFPSSLGSIRQAFWLLAQRERDGMEKRRSRRLWIRLETASGELLGLSLLDAVEDAVDQLASLRAALDPPTLDWDVLCSRLSAAWLIAPDYRGAIRDSDSIDPGSDWLDEARVWLGIPRPPVHGIDPLEPFGEKLREITQGFVSRLDRLVIRQLGRQLAQGSPRVRDYNTYAAWSQPQRRYRLQAIWEFPWIEELFRDRPTLNDAQDVARLASTIDRAEPLLPAIAHAFGVRPAAIRRMRQAAGLTPNLAWARCLAWIFEAGFPSPVPSDGEVDWVEMLLHAIALSGWLQDRELTMRLARDLDPDRLRSLLRRAQEDELHSNLLAEVLSQYGQHLDPTSRRRGLDRFRGMLLSDGVARTLHAVACWLDIAARYEPDGKDATWPGLFERPVHLDGLVAVELLDAEALRLEGDVMEHCVAEHWRACLRGMSRVFSVRHLEGGHLSTMEIVVGQANVLCLEHRGKNNQVPPPAAVRMEHHLCRLIQNAVDKGCGKATSA